MNKRKIFLVSSIIAILTVLTASHLLNAQEPGVFNVKDFGARGDGKTLDTVAINKAIESASRFIGGRVEFPPGKFLSGTIKLKNNVILHFQSGSHLIGTTNLNEYENPTPPASMPEAKWGKWHRGLIVGENVENVIITGSGIIDGNKVFDPTGEERMRGPHTIIFVNCKNFKIKDISIVDAANYAILFFVSDDVEVHNVSIYGGWDGVHFRGSPERYCKNIRITNCRMFTGDDSIAGRYWDNTVISDCILNSSCNGIRIIGPVKNLIIHNCLLYGPGEYPHRTSNRYNMLAGINLQPGAWDATTGLTDNILISDITMRNVATAFHFSMRKGNSAGTITVNRASATGVYRSAASVESWGETPFTNVVFRDVTIEYKGGGTAEQGKATVKTPGVDARPLPVWGFYARAVKNIRFDNVRLRCDQPDLRPALMFDSVDNIRLDNFDFDLFPDAPYTVVLTNVNNVILSDEKLKKFFSSEKLTQQK